MRDLNDLVSNSTFRPVDRGKINDRGQIVGIALTELGELHGFLASPDSDDSGDAQTSTAVAKPARPAVALPELVQKTLERQKLLKSRHLGPGSTLEGFALARAFSSSRNTRAAHTSEAVDQR